jgi:hypothetical protein
VATSNGPDAHIVEFGLQGEEVTDVKTLKYEWALQHLQREKEKTRAFYVEPHKAAVSNKDIDEIERLDSEEMHETQSIEDKISRLQTSFLIEEAQRLLIPTPAFDTKEDSPWERAVTASHYQLKREQLAALRSAIRKEKKERREGLQSWAALSIGLVGALIGLFSALKK